MYKRQDFSGADFSDIFGDIFGDLFGGGRRGGRASQGPMPVSYTHLDVYKRQLGDNPRLIEAAKRTYDEKGYGVASVRFICGTQDIHKKLEKKISDFLGTDDTILYSSCFDANGGLFETILTAEDAVISDELNHASIIDGVRLCKAKRFRYKNNDMEDLEAKLKEADEAGARIKLIATDRCV